MNVVVGQSGGPTTVINASLAGVYQAAVAAGANKVYGMQNGISGFLKEKLILLNDVLNGEDKIEVQEEADTGFWNKIAEWISGIFSGS